LEVQTNLEGDNVKPWAGVCCKACYHAKGKRCGCKCKGKYHGLGRKKTSENNTEASS